MQLQKLYESAKNDMQIIKQFLHNQNELKIEKNKILKTEQESDLIQLKNV